MIDEQLIKDKSKLAILYFKSNEFSKALSLFNTLIEKLKNLPIEEIKNIRLKYYDLSENPKYGKLVHPKLCTLLDQRASTYEKLNNLTKALQDSNTILKIDPFNVKGYLRSGKILILQNKKFEAYKIYQNGIYVLKTFQKNNCKEDIDLVSNCQTTLIEKLKSQYSSLNRELKLEKEISTNSKSGNKSISPLSSISLSQSSSNSLSRSSSKSSSQSSSQPNKRRKIESKNLDPFKHFPIEVIDVILKHLSTNEIFNCMRCCKKWYITVISLQLFEFKCKNNITLDEFINGLKFFKKNVRGTYSKSINLRINQVYNSKIYHILSIIIKENQINFKSLDLSDLNLNLQNIYHVFFKSGWRLNNFKFLKELNLGINCSIKSSHTLLNIFPNLKKLKIITIVPEKSVLNNLPINDKLYNRYKDLVLDDYKNLENLILINHSKLLDSNIMRISNETYTPFPPNLIKNSFSQLSELTIVSFDLSNHLPVFGEFMINSQKLKKLYFENNKGINLIILLQMFLNYKPNFKLTSFTFREYQVENILNLQELGNIEIIPELSYVENLDLYKNNLSQQALIKILKFCYQTVVTLNIGNSTYLDFSNHKVNNLDHRFITNLTQQRQKQFQIQLNEILKKCINLKNLYLNELNIDTIGIMNIIKQFEKLFQEIDQKPKILNLDLSFNNFDGIDLLKLLNCLESTKLINLNFIDINGLGISQDTIEFSLKKKLVSNTNFDQSRIKWLQYGGNSLIIN
ncbi:DIA2 [Candida jiufengensis]|uniref:DIA2 n=1 Tax=Candida jiufengensis TaxID=497108 RepID=UPI002224208C|nr:DIA2 [Candida jiufengensis]KAI5953209.1 DIA2 [Candida jiufengensis]